jgi:hypothetical protein
MSLAACEVDVEVDPRGGRYTARYAGVSAEGAVGLSSGDSAPCRIGSRGNPGDFAPKTYHINRSDNLTQYLQRHGWRKANMYERAEVSMWDAYRGQVIDAHTMVWPRRIFTNVIDCLYTWHARLVRLDIEHVAPQTILEWRKPANKLSRRDFESTPVWFLKEIQGVHGRGITLVSKYEDYLTKLATWPTRHAQMQGPAGMEPMPDNFLLQRGECDVALIEGRKFVLRVYLLSLADGRAFIYKDCFYYTALNPVQQDSDDGQTKFNVHVSHWRQDIEGAMGISDTRKMGRLSSQTDIYPEVLDSLVANARDLSKIWTDQLVQAKGAGHTIPPQWFHLWGSDYIVRSDLSTVCLELNAFPNLNHGDPYHGAKEAAVRPFEVDFRNQGFDRDFMRSIGYDLEGVGPDMPSGWIQVADPCPDLL